MVILTMALTTISQWIILTTQVMTSTKGILLCNLLHTPLLEGEPGMTQICEVEDVNLLWTGFFELLIFLPWGRPEHWAVVLQRARITRERIACSTVLSFQDFWSRTLSCYLQAMLYSLSMSVAFPVYNVKFYKTGFLNPLSKWSWDWETFVKTSILLLSSFTVLCTFE